MFIKILLRQGLKRILLLKYKNLETDKKRIIANFFSLSTLEVVNYIIPLITLPYLVRVLGPGKYGIVAFAQVFAWYFVIAADYGFYLSAPRKISINRDDISLVSKIYSRIMIIKFLFMLISTGIFFVLILSISRFTNDKLVFLFSMLNVLADFLFPAWFFQGIERMKLITYFYFIAKGFFLITIFLFIKTPAAYLYVPLFNNLGLIISGFLSLYVIHKNYKIKIYFPTLEEIKEEIKDEFYYFVSTVSINAYTNSGTFILGLFAGNVFVGYYSAAERLIRAIQRILWAASQSVYPHINRLVSESSEKGLKFIKRLMFFFCGSFFLISLVIFVFARIIISLVLGAQYTESYYVLLILAFLPFVISLGNIFGIQTMLPLGMIKPYSKIVFIAAILNILFSMVMANLLRHIGIAVAVLLTEIFIVISTLLYLKNKKIKIGI